jgi:hypothetical protein
VQAPDYARIETVLSFDWYTELDDRPPEPFAARLSTMEWVGSVDLPEAGVHGLRLVATTPAQVFLDGVLVASVEGALEGQTVETEVVGNGDRVPIVVRTVRDGRGGDWRFWKLQLLWRGAAGEWTAFARYHLPAVEIAPVP